MKNKILQIKGIVRLIIDELMSCIRIVHWNTDWWNEIHQVWNKYFWSCNCKLPIIQTSISCGFDTERYRAANLIPRVDNVVHVNSPNDSLFLYKPRSSKTKYKFL